MNFSKKGVFLGVEWSAGVQAIIADEIDLASSRASNIGDVTGNIASFDWFKDPEYLERAVERTVM